MVCGFQELTGSLQDLLTQAMEHIKGQETGMTALKLASLTLEGYPQVSDIHEHIYVSSNQQQHTQQNKLSVDFIFAEATD